MRWIGRVLGIVGAVAAAAVLWAGAASAHGSGAPHNYGSSGLGKVVLGLGRSGTPFAFLRDGLPRGFELDLANAVAEKMEVELEVRWLDRDALLPALLAGEVDLVNLGAIAGEVPDDVDVVPYLRIGEHVVVRHDNPFAIHEAEDLSGTMVVATMGSDGEGFARELETLIDETGKAPMDVHTMPLGQYTPVAVRFAHASAYFAPTAAVAMQGAEPEAELKSVPGLFKPTARLGFAFRVDAAELKRDLRLALAQVVTKGDYRRLLAAYNIPEDASPFR